MVAHVVIFGSGRLRHTPLEPARLSRSARQVLASTGIARMMVAKGLAPLSNSIDVVNVLYQLAVDDDPRVRAQAMSTSILLPEGLLAAALGNPATDSRVIDFFAKKNLLATAAIEAVLRNKSTADETVAYLASCIGEREVEILAENEQRLLRCPEIMLAMHTNSKARRSTVDRALELAARNSVLVPGIPIRRCT